MYRDNQVFTRSYYVQNVRRVEIGCVVKEKIGVLSQSNLTLYKQQHAESSTPYS